MSKTKHGGQVPAENNAGEQQPAEQNQQALEEKLAELQQELEASAKKAQENLDGWQRERADFVNYRRRIERDQQQLRETITGDLIRKYLVIQDDMDRAIKSRPAEGDLAAWAAGIDLIARKLQAILDQEGIQRIPAEGEAFDPAVHEALSQEDSPEHESGHVIDVFQDGYTLGGRVLRPARVRVAR